MNGDAISHLVPLVPENERAAKLFALPLYASHPRIAETACKSGFSFSTRHRRRRRDGG